MFVSPDKAKSQIYLRSPQSGCQPETASQASAGSKSSAGSQLTMGIIGCLPDNVQQAIKSFSVREGKQQITLAFPFMEDLTRGFADTPSLTEENSGKFRFLTPALFLDTSPEVIHGFETIMTLVPSTHRSNHIVGLVTINQRANTEGLNWHMDALVTCLLSKKDICNVWNIPFVACDLSESQLEGVLGSCSRAVMKVYGDLIYDIYPGKTTAEILYLVKKEVVGPSLVPYGELLSINIQEILKKLEASSFSVSPEYFSSAMDALRSSSCSITDFRKLHVYFTNPQMDPAVKEFWKLWSHEQIACKVFPVAAAANKLGSMCYTSSQGGTYLVSESQGTMSPLLGHSTHVAIKEGLQNIIKCLKNQDITNSQSLSPDRKTDKGNCNCRCVVCRKDFGCGRVRRYEKFQNIGSPSSESAFHRPASCSSGANKKATPRSHHLYYPPSQITFCGATTTSIPMKHPVQLINNTDNHQSSLPAPVPQHVVTNYNGFVPSCSIPCYPWRIFADQ